MSERVNEMVVGMVLIFRMKKISIVFQFIYRHLCVYIHDHMDVLVYAYVPESWSTIQFFRNTFIINKSMSSFLPIIIHGRIFCLVP